jgi:hypothetical protein
MQERGMGNFKRGMKRHFSPVIHNKNYCFHDLRMNWSNNLSKKLRNSYNAMKRLLREINI